MQAMMRLFDYFQSTAVINDHFPLDAVMFDSEEEAHRLVLANEYIWKDQADGFSTNWDWLWSCGLSTILAQSVRASLIVVCCNNVASCFSWAARTIWRLCVAQFALQTPGVRLSFHVVFKRVSPNPTLVLFKEKHEDARWWSVCHESLMEMSVFIFMTVSRSTMSMQQSN